MENTRRNSIDTTTTRINCEDSNIDNARDNTGADTGIYNDRNVTGGNDAIASTRRSDDDVPAMDSEGTSFINNETRDTTAQAQAPWTPGVWARFPWIATVSFFLSLCLAGCMILVTTLADRTNVESWAVSPPVLLALTSTSANVLIHVALARGAAVTWWFLSMHPNRQTRVKDLHWRWAAAEGLSDALGSIFTRGFSKTAVACSFVTIVAINSPLLQRALSVRTQENIVVGVPAGRPVYAAPVLPLRFGGFVGDRNLRITNPTEAFSLLLAEYHSRSPMVLPGEGNVVGPNKTYRTTIPAAGYRVNCTDDSDIRLPSFEEVENETQGSGIAAYSSNFTDIFVSAVSYLEEYGVVADTKMLATTIHDPLRDIRSVWSWLAGGEDALAAGRVFWYDTLWKAKSGCINETHGAELRARRCDISPAVVKYPVVVSSNNTITLLELEGGRSCDDVVPGSIETREQAINETKRAGWQYSTHGGLALFMANRFSANYTMRGDSFLLDSGYWESYVEGYYPYELLRTGKSSCDRWFTDPGPAVFRAVREIGLRSALMAANSSDPSHKLELVGDTTETIAIYLANFGFLYGAVGVTVLAALSVVPLFYGFWKLGRDVSLSPLETAKAFRPVQLGGAASNSTVSELLKRVGSREIRYGVVNGGTVDERKEMVLGMDDPRVTVYPEEFQRSVREL
ncbi:hypothetical protein QBC43DRAFT_319389 [Cladorrhinum sp. PSN259]|nr:hypothetical protein QBC43DRAFT_319389 [Cladorrhinum sp. PSN259]